MTLAWGTLLMVSIYLALHSRHLLTLVGQGLTAAQVQVIFSLPEEYGSFPEPLAYVEWFTHFGNPVPDLGMYQI